MSSRISTSMMFNQSVSLMMAKQAKLSHLEQQIATGSKIVSAKDDPVAAGTAVGLDRSLAALDRMKLNAGNVQNRLGVQENTLAQVNELMARVNALARRPHLKDAETVLRVGDLEMDLIARKVTRGGMLIDLQPREFRLLEGERLVVTRVGQLRELLRADAHDFEIGAAGRDLHLVVGRGIDSHVDVGQLTNDRGEALHGQRDAAALLHLGLDLAADAEVEVGGREGDLILFCLDEHVAQDGHGRLRSHDVEDLSQAVAEVVAVDLEFHRAVGALRCFSQTMDR